MPPYAESRVSIRSTALRQRYNRQFAMPTTGTMAEKSADASQRPGTTSDHSPPVSQERTRRSMNITLITDVLPDDSFTAGQVLRNMLRTLNADHVSVLWINQSRLKRTSDDTLYTVTREYNF